jgi:hypothetical protein
MDLKFRGETYLKRNIVMEKKLQKASAWDEIKVIDYLHQTIAPCRLSSISKKGFPNITSLWYIYEDGMILFSARSNSEICKRLQSNNKVGFEVAKDDPPYMGVRGVGVASIKPSNEIPILETLINRYLGSTQSTLAKWLLSKPENESTICLSMERVTSWDYSKRM